MLGHTYFSHVDFLLEEGQYQGGLLGASFNPDGPVIVGSPRGVAIRPQNYQSFGIRRRMILKTPQADAILAFAKSQIGKPFDSGALSPKVFLADPFYGSVESRDWHNPNQWFCAELVICSFEEGGYWGPGVKVPIYKNRVTPADYYTLHMMDPNFVNRETFFNPVPDLQMGPYEI